MSCECNISYILNCYPNFYKARDTKIGELTTERNAEDTTVERKIAIILCIIEKFKELSYYTKKSSYELFFVNIFY